MMPAGGRVVYGDAVWTQDPTHLRHSTQPPATTAVHLCWDGGSHAFVLDTAVHPDHQRRGIGAALVHTAAREAARAGCEWLHVDYEPHLRAFYQDSCGFRPTAAGLFHLT